MTKANKKNPINLIGISGKIGSGKDTVGKVLQWIVTSKTGFGNGTYSNKECEEWLNGKYPGDTSIQEISNYQIKKFADKLKDIVCLLIGCTREQLEDREFKDKELGEEWWYYDGHQFGANKLIPYNHKGSPISDKFLIKLTPRKLLQLLGTDCGRDIIHPNIWVNALFADYGDRIFNEQEGEWEYPNWIMTDVRFPNEVQAIKDRGGIVIRVNRPVNLRFPKLWKLYTSSNKFVNKAGKFLAWLSGHDKEMWEKLNHPSETALDDYEFDHVIDNNGSIEELVEKVKQLNLV